MEPSCVIVYLASPRDREHGGTLRRDMLLASLKSAKACLPVELPVIVFHEDYTEEDKALLRSVGLQCDFHEVDFSGGDSDFVHYRRPKGYMLMCRFWSGEVQRHPAPQKYSHYCRLDDDSFFINPKMRAENFARMLRADYSYRMVFVDWSDEHEHLFEFTKDFMRGEGLTFSAIDLLREGRYFGLAPYQNFHVASLRFWRHPLIKKYVDAIEAEKGCLRHGWLDANVHAFLISVLAPHTDLLVNRETLWGYRHNVHVAVFGNAGLRLDERLPFVVQPEEYA